jgi:hypothetical protein
MHSKYLSEYCKGRGDVEDIFVGWRKTLNWILKRFYVRMWFYLAQSRAFCFEPFSSMKGKEFLE